MLPLGTRPSRKKTNLDYKVARDHAVTIVEIIRIKEWIVSVQTTLFKWLHMRMSTFSGLDTVTVKSKD